MLYEVFAEHRVSYDMSRSSSDILNRAAHGCSHSFSDARFSKDEAGPVRCRAQATHLDHERLRCHYGEPIGKQPGCGLDSVAF